MNLHNLLASKFHHIFNNDPLLATTSAPTTIPTSSTVTPSTTEVPTTAAPSTTEVPTTATPSTTEVPTTAAPTTTEVPTTDLPPTSTVNPDCKVDGYFPVLGDCNKFYVCHNGLRYDQVNSMPFLKFFWLIFTHNILIFAALQWRSCFQSH